MSTKITEIEEEIIRVKSLLMDLGAMRPGTIGLQYRDRKEKKGPFYQVSYTHKRKSRTEYLRKENLKAVEVEIENYKAFKELVDRWVDLSLELSQLRSKEGFHSDKME